MSRLKINGTDIRELAEFTTNATLTNTNIFSYTPQRGKISGVLTSESEFVPTMAGSNYIYGSKDAAKGKIKKNGTIVSLAEKGCRPMFTNLLAELGAGLYYLNFFSDGEVWLSSAERSRSGINISTASQKRRTFLVCLYGAGGGGGSSKNGSKLFYNSAGAGGGGGGMSCGCLYLNKIPSSQNYTTLTVGSGGSGGANGGGGLDGGYSCVGAHTSGWVAYGGKAGAGDDGSGGAGGDGTCPNTSFITGFTYKQLVTATGASGINGSNKSNTTTSTSAQAGTKYLPEGGTFTYSPGYTVSGKTNSGGDRPGGAGGCGYAGKGGQSTGDGTTGRGGETSGGGSGGAPLHAKNLAGGRGGDGLIRIYY